MKGCEYVNGGTFGGWSQESTGVLGGHLWGMREFVGGEVEVSLDPQCCPRDHGIHQTCCG